MKTFLVVFLSTLCFAVAGFAQAPAGQGAAQLPYTSQELDQIVGPIALYPDPLISLILPASTVPSDIVMANRFMSQGGDLAQVPMQPWDDSVKALTHYPNLLKWLDQNLDWTTQLGSAFLAQPGDVMDAIQDLRARAKADGTLVSDAQQVVGTDDSGNITIEPASDDTIYVPQYDSAAVYDDQYNADDGTLLTYGTGCPVGPWLSYWPDWRYRGIFLGEWQREWNNRGRTGYGDDANMHQWHPNTGRPVQYPVRSAGDARPVIITPRPLPGVTLPRGRHASALSTSGLTTSGLTTSSLTTSGLRTGSVGSTQRDFTGRGVVSSSGDVVTPPSQEVEPLQEPVQSAINGYQRGSDARDASNRGRSSRQAGGSGPGPHSPARPEPPGAPAAPVNHEPVYHPPVEHAPPVVNRPEPPPAPPAPVAAPVREVPVAPQNTEGSRPGR